MTREEAIEYLNTFYMAFAVFPNQQISLGDVDKMKESVNMAIKALEQEPSGDLISRQAVIDYITDCCIDLSYINGTNMVIDDILKLPSATPTVIENIKAEIRQQQWYLGVDNVNQVIEIIDKHINHKAESEEV